MKIVAAKPPSSKNSRKSKHVSDLLVTGLEVDIGIKKSFFSCWMLGTGGHGWSWWPNKRQNLLMCCWVWGLNSKLMFEILPTLLVRTLISKTTFMIFLSILHNTFEFIVHDNEHESWSNVTDSSGTRELPNQKDLAVLGIAVGDDWMMISAAVGNGNSCSKASQRNDIKVYWWVTWEQKKLH